jgi:hypothetical protein
MNKMNNMNNMNKISIATGRCLFSASGAACQRPAAYAMSHNATECYSKIGSRKMLEKDDEESTVRTVLRSTAGRKQLRKIMENNVRKFAIVLSTCLLVAPLGATIANAQNIRSEAAAHPRIAQAIRDLEDAIAYMEAAPNNFGGHKAAALDASRAAVSELRASLAFRADQDRRF